jgi:Carboxypeptidase regulatory-like domain/TonB dependent receptor
MTPSATRVLCALLAVLALSSFAHAQTSSSTLTGVVVDSAGGVVPGATVVVKNSATGFTTEAVTNTSGAFGVPSLDPGTYTVTISLTGFKTAVIADVRLLAARPTEVKATLEIGALNETVEVSSRSELIQTQATAVTSTITSEQINNLPLVSRNTLYFTTFLPGVETTGGPRGSTIMGLPQNTINITIDGVSNSNNFQSGDGFFSMVTPRTDAVEEITVSGATPGANNAGAGAVSIAFVTRSGTNQFDTSIYHYFRHPYLNSNYYFNKINGLERNEVIVHQYGGRAGGPIYIPGLVDGRGKAFFFFNMEHFYQPTEATRTRTILSPDAERGIFTYNAGGTTRQVNLIALAASTGNTATMDPVTSTLFAQIRSAAQTTGRVSTPANFINTQRYVYQTPGTRNEYAPTTRLDFNLTDKHRLTGTYYWQRFHSDPDLLNGSETQFPGSYFTNYGIQASYRTTGSIGMRSTLTSNLVNEIKGGWQWSPVDFSGNVTHDMFANQGNFNLDLDNNANNTEFTNLSNVTATNNPQPRNTTNWGIENTLSWVKGTHSFTFGGAFNQITHDQNSSNLVPSITFGVDTTNDPARTMFSTTNFPNASNAQLALARHLYALLTGRVTSIGATARLNPQGEYVYLGNLNSRSRMNDVGLFAQDSWRVKPTLTLNYGLRWEVQFPFKPLTNTFSTVSMVDICGISGQGNGPGGRECHLFQPGNIPAPNVVPQYVQYDAGNPGFDTDFNNVAPNIGVAWRPNVQNGWLRRLLGDPDQATVRGGYSVAFNRERMDRFTGLYGGNVGGSAAATRNATTGFSLVRPGESWPLLYRETHRLGPPVFPTSPNYPIPASLGAGNDLNMFHPTIQTPSTESWMIGIQRAIGRDTAVEVRYVGNRNRDAWTTENWNDLNIFENNFLEEFKLAQANLRSHIAAGCGTTGNPACSFAYRGPGTGTSPLPTYLAFFSGIPMSQAGNAALYTSGNFTNNDWTGHLSQYEPDPFDAANDLWTGSQGQFRNNALGLAGVPRNWFVLNPAVDDANVTVAAAGSRYHSLQIDLRRRLSRGFTIQGNYTYAQRWGSSLEDIHRERSYPKTDNVPHAFKVNWVYEVPVGRGKRHGSNMNPILNGVIGNWEFSGTGRVQVRDFGVTLDRLVGMTEDELKDAFEIRVFKDPNTGTVTVFNLPDDIITNTRRAFNTDPTSPTGYPAGEEPTGRYIAPASSPGCIALFFEDCNTPEQIWVRGPWFVRFDLSFKKRFPFGRGASFDLQFDLLNAFDNVNFNPNFNPGSGNTIFQVTSGYTDINTTFDPGGRLGQIVWRLNW